MRARLNWSRWVCSVLLAITAFAGWSSAAWASTRIGSAEMQMWYRQRQTFHTNGGENFEWVQWRNEVFFWLIYDDFVKNGKVLNQDSLALPFVQNATLNARYRFRADPVWTLRESYTKRYDSHERKSYLFPENGFRDLFVDLDFGRVGVGNLSTRIGYQQIVWGESDLYRSIDVINPLRIDQNQGAGEKFDEFRLPIFAFKANYNVGNVGNWFSNVFLEPFFTPAFRGPNSYLIADGAAARAPFHMKGCLNDNNKLVEYSPSNCSFRRADGSRVFVPWNRTWGRSRAGARHPWAYLGRTNNIRGGTGDYANPNPNDTPDIAGTRTSTVASFHRGKNFSALNGMWNEKTMAGGMRMFGTSVSGFDFSLNYAFIPQGPSGIYDISDSFGSPVYGDADTAQALGLGTPAGTFEEGLRRCLGEEGRMGPAKKDPSQTKGHRGTTLVGADLNGYNNPARFGKNGALLPNGDAKPGRHGATRPPITACPIAKFHWTNTHIVGFTSTYNDFEYTGAVFRLEESWSSKEYVRQLPIGVGRNSPNANGGAGPDLTPSQLQQLTDHSFNKDHHKYSPVWRSMVGFDLLRTYKFFSYIPGLDRSFSEQAWFLSGQWLMKNQMNANANPLCYTVDNTGNGLTKEQAKAKSREDGKRHYSNPQCRTYRFEHLFTLGFGNQGLFASRVESRNAVVYEPRSKDWLLFSQWWWRNVLGMENVELSTGVAWYPGSALSQGWTGLWAFADRDQLWFEFTYYLL